ncbi:GNAT family N-acetyltransferase [Planococcus halocryophilus]|uniref:GNAT family N-acetyltransferase n=1 Tax=Planococcus halocryophilus TaxID=1215089 RepID=UPI001F0EDF87|nr:GNAT family N-acetyltransferase [Planococcus halocryophilus]MCH4825189.1 GNAT family N-acetyltransferase [Planococcus halocryophilus]
MDEKMSLNKIQEEIRIHQITKGFEEEARELILKGLEERFGFIDPTYNPDLKDISYSYSRRGTVFLVGIYNGRIICTGAITHEAPGVGRIERMSVLKGYRRIGVAKIMMYHLESWAKQEGYQQLVLETNGTWYSAIEFYKSQQYHLYLVDGECDHFSKKLF